MLLVGQMAAFYWCVCISCVKVFLVFFFSSIQHAKTCSWPCAMCTMAWKFIHSLGRWAVTVIYLSNSWAVLTTHIDVFKSGQALTLLIDAREYEKSIEQFALAGVVYIQKHVPIVLNTLTEPVCVRIEVVCKAQLPGSATKAAALSLLWKEWVQSCCH